jgi:hypothetical protein
MEGKDNFRVAEEGHRGLSVQEWERLRAFLGFRERRGERGET